MSASWLCPAGAGASDSTSPHDRVNCLAHGHVGPALAFSRLVRSPILQRRQPCERDHRHRDRRAGLRASPSSRRATGWSAPARPTSASCSWFLSALILNILIKLSSPKPAKSFLLVRSESGMCAGKRNTDRFGNWLMLPPPAGRFKSRLNRRRGVRWNEH